MSTRFRNSPAILHGRRRT